jgi:hypothetical protein
MLVLAMEFSKGRRSVSEAGLIRRNRQEAHHKRWALSFISDRSLRGSMAPENGTEVA